MMRAADGRVTRSLEWKLPSLIAGLVLFVVLVYCWASYREMRRSSIATAHGRLDVLVRELAATSGGTLSGRLRGLSTQGAIQHVLESDAARDSAVRSLRRVIGGQDSILRAVQLWTRDGALRFSVGEAFSAADSSRLRMTMDQVARTDSTRRSALFVDGAHVVSWTVFPISNGGSPTGFLAELRRATNAPGAESAIRELTGQDVTIQIANRTGDVWTDLRGAPIRPAFGLDSVPESFTVAGANGEPVLGSRAAISGTPWTLILTLPEATVLEHPFAFLQRMLAIGVLLVLAGALGAWMLSRHVTRPLRAIIDATTAVTEGDYGSRVTLARADEIGLLAERFNTMAARIGDSHTELAKRVAEAQSANEAKSVFLAMMSHELRTPLNAISGYTELLELGVRGPISEMQRQDLIRIRRNGQHLLALINSILNLSRIESGHLALDPADLPVDELMNDIEALIAPQVALKELRYRVIVDGEALVVRADRERLQQALVNLVSNAVRFTDPGGSITVSCRAADDTVLLSVADTGIGIPPDQLEAIFEPFVQLDSGLTRRAGGTGLGLAISRELVTAMGGRITVASIPDMGSTFTIELPRVVMAGHAMRSPEPVRAKDGR